MDSFRVKIVYTRLISLFDFFSRIMATKCENHLILEIFYLREKSVFSSHFEVTTKSCLYALLRSLVSRPISLAGYEAMKGDLALLQASLRFSLFPPKWLESNLLQIAELFVHMRAYTLSHGVMLSAICVLIRFFMAKRNLFKK